MYDVIVIGGGPAGLTAGIYTARKKLSTLVIVRDLPVVDLSTEGGAGMEFVVANFKKILAQTNGYLELKKQIAVLSLEKNVVSFSVEDQSGKIYYGRSVIVASGEDATGHGNTEFDAITEKTVHGKIKVNDSLQSTVPGIFAAGHVNSSLGKDTFIASAEGAKAALVASEYLENLS